MNTEDAPVLVVTDKDGYLIQAGEPTLMNKKKLVEYIIDGATLKTMTIKEFRETKWNWIYDKPKNLES